MLTKREEKFIIGAVSGASWVSTEPEPSSSPAAVYVQTGAAGKSLTQPEAFELIRHLAVYAGLRIANEADAGVVIYSPVESEAVRLRKDALANEFLGSGFRYKHISSSSMCKAIDHIVQGEIARGELK